MYISKRTLKEILDSIGSHSIESGGIIGYKNDNICSFIFDDSFTSQYEYRPNVEYLNNEIEKWNAGDISFCGIVHSHLYGFNFPSESDRLYAQKLFTYGTNITKLFFPIVTLNAINEPNIDFYQYVDETNSFLKLVLRQVDDTTYILLPGK